MKNALSVVWLAPLCAALLSARLADRARARLVALAGAGVAFAVAVGLFVVGVGSGFASIELVAAPVVAGFQYHVGVDGLSWVLLPVTAALAFGALLAAPRADLDGRAAARVLVTDAGLLGCLVSLDLGLLTLFWVAALVPVALSVRRGKDRVLAAVIDLAVGGSTALLVAATVALGVHGARAGLVAPLDLAAHAALAEAHPAPTWVGVLVLLAALLRMGVFPLHAWVPLAVERGPVHLVVVAVLTPIGSFLLARLALPLFPEVVVRAAPLLLGLGVVTALYGALLAVGQHDLRRLLGFVLVSLSGFVLAGIASLNEPSVAGSLLQAAAVSVACSGLVLLAAAIEARAATVDMRRLGGIVRQAPFMASLFLVFALAAVGFPGTVLFVSEDLLVQGLLQRHAAVAATLLVVTAVNGVTLVRAYKRTFLGPSTRHAADLRGFEDLLPRERWVAVTVLVTLLAGGFAAAPLLAVRRGVLSVLRPAPSDASHEPPAAPSPPEQPEP
ncbi:MAG: hypothetical protein IT373_24110 [Polyangiaceae bacterium]|nr:hypothetical protein [Polyangiaceae bacterium]